MSIEIAHETEARLVDEARSLTEQIEQACHAAL